MSAKKNPTRRVRCNLLEAEVYVRYPVCLIDGKPVRQYCELQEIPCANGVIENYVAVDYPITPESVNSYADSADYKKNPDIVMQAVPRQNLGDISEVQKVLANDMSAMREMLAQSKDVIGKLEAYRKDMAAQNVSDEKQETAKSEVTNNG